jgi:hypothetical protein
MLKVGSISRPAFMALRASSSRPRRANPAPRKKNATGNSGWHQPNGANSSRIPPPGGTPIIMAAVEPAVSRAFGRRRGSLSGPWRRNREDVPAPKPLIVATSSPPAAATPPNPRETSVARRQRHYATSFASFDAQATLSAPAPGPRCSVRDRTFQRRRMMTDPPSPLCSLGSMAGINAKVWARHRRGHEVP